MELELLFLLLPLAVLSGWWIGRREDHRTKDVRSSRYHDEYFRGLNYLINEQSDKAIEVFVRMVEVDSETVDTHFALGSLFRRRGEVDRAIRIHQNLIARPALSVQQRNQALFELARDYQSAGLLDRAEGLYEQLARDKHFGAVASRQLLDIYQQERDWNQAIETAQRLKGNREFEVESLLCHYHCELAEQAIAQGQYAEAAELLRQAPGEGRASIRASLLDGQVAVAMGNGSRAIQALQRIEHLGAEFVPETLDSLRQAFELSGRHAEWTSYLETLATKHGLTSVVLARCAELELKEGPEAAAHFLGEFLNSHPSLAGMERLIALQQTAGHTEGLPVLSKIASLLTQAKPRYRCKHCGFSSRTLYWQCPGCKRWGTIKPIHGIEGE